MHLFLKLSHISCLPFFTQHLYLHPLLKQTERLCEIADTKLVSGLPFCVFHFEKEPLLVALCVCINLAEQVVLLDYHLIRSSLCIYHLVIDAEGLNSLNIARFDS